MPVSVGIHPFSGKDNASETEQPNKMEEPKVVVAGAAANIPVSGENQPPDDGTNREAHEEPTAANRGNKINAEVLGEINTVVGVDIATLDTQTSSYATYMSKEDEKIEKMLL